MRLSEAEVLAKREPFWLGPERGPAGILLVHGFTGTPFEMRFLGESLAARGFTVHGPTLAGHCAGTHDLAGTRWPDWHRTVNQAFDELAERCERVAVCGQSLGGLLTLELARLRPEVAAIALLATALWLPPQAVLLDRWIQRLGPIGDLALPKLAGSDILDSDMRQNNRIAQGGAGMPLRALHSLVELGAHTKAHLAEVTAPAFIAHARHDHTIPFACHAYLVREIGSKVRREMVLDRSRHVISLDVEREQLFLAVGDHLAAHFGAKET